MLWQSGVISFLFGPVRGYHRTGPQCLPTPPVSASSVYAAIMCWGGLGSVCYIWSISTLLSGVLCEFKNAVSNSLFLSLFLSLSRRTWALGPCLRTTWHDYSLLSLAHLAVLLLQFQLFCLRLWIPDLFTGRATCPRPAVFNSLQTAGVVEILLMIGYEKPTDIYS